MITCPKGTKLFIFLSFARLFSDRSPSVSHLFSFFVMTYPTSVRITVEVYKYIKLSRSAIDLKNMFVCLFVCLF